MLSDYRTLVADRVKDDAAKLSQTNVDAAIALAVARYSKDRPREVVEDLTPTDANTLPLPAAWEADFSDLVSLEYPVGQLPPSLVQQDRLYAYRTPSTQVIKLLDAVTVAAAAVRATLKVKHQVTTLVDTIPTQDREPVACWAAALLCDDLAALYAGGTDSTIQADVVKSDSKAAEYARRGAALRKRYLNELGVDDKRTQAAGAVVTMEPVNQLGYDPLLHGRAAVRRRGHLP